MTEAATRNRHPAGGPDRRRQARLAAVQALYQVDMGKLTPRSVIFEFLEHRLDEEIDGLRLGRIDRTLFGELVEKVPQRRGELDDMIAAVLGEEWSVERLETVLRIILECGAYEMAERQAVPARAIINEYVEMARAFFNEREPSLVNGVLDKLAHTLRAEEFGADAGA